MRATTANGTMIQMPRTPPARLLFLPFAAFLVVLPLVLNGSSCGHDFSFHLSSWLDAAQQIRHGVLLPRWTISAAWYSGEPRFLFYPPLSWLLGAVLTLAFTPAAAPVLFTWIALTAAAFTMYRLAREFTTSHIALLAAALYIVNPYMLFTAYERTAYGELLAAAWLPLLVAAELRARPRVTSIAIPIALLWLTNAPAAIIGSYVFTAILAIRIVLLFFDRKSSEALTLLLRSIFGIALGAALAGFYLIPAAYERRFVQIEMAIIPNMRFQDNFLFGHTADAPHNVVLHTASLVALTLLALTIIPLVLFFLRSRKFNTTTFALTTLTLLIAFFLTPLSTPFWDHLPEFAFLQFPWRLLSLLGVVFALTVALLLSELARSGAPFIVRAMSGLGTPLAITTVTLASTFLCIYLFRQGCELPDQPSVHAQLFASGHGAGPTDEYTPTNADNDFLRTDNPAYWLADDPQAFAPNTTPNPAATIVNYDATPPIDQTISTPAPHHLVLDLPQLQILILNLRDYPAWRLTRNGQLLSNRVQRDDGLIAIPLPAGHSTIDIAWRRTPDQLIGLVLTTLALLTLGFLSIYSYRTQCQPDSVKSLTE